MEQFNRGTGLLIIEVRYSNPNGDPDAESDPRTVDVNGHGLISPVSFKRKLRDLVGDQPNGEVWKAAAEALQLSSSNGHKYGILESRGRDRDAIVKMKAEEFLDTYWDARVFGNTFLEEIKDKANKGNREHFIATGAVQFGPGISIAPVAIERLTNTNKAGVETGKDRGMAPLGWRVVRHGLYAMPFFVNPLVGRKTNCTKLDIGLMQFVIPHVYRCTASAVRPFVEVRHAWYAEHKSPLGSCSDGAIVDALMPKKRENPDEPSKSYEEYAVPVALPDAIGSRLSSFQDLCAKAW